MKKTMAVLGAVGLAVGAALAGGVSAQATDDDEASKPYVYVAWRIDDQSVSQADLDAQNHATIFPQTLAGSWPTDSDAKEQFRDQLQCGTAYQTDVYFSSETTDVLIVGGVLHAAQNPPEDHVRDDGSTWDVFRTGACLTVVPIQAGIDHTDPCGPDNLVVNVPEPVEGIAWASSTDSVSGRVTVTATALPGFVLSREGVERVQTLTWGFADSGEACPVVVPELAETGLTPLSGLLGVGAFGLALLGVGLVVVRCLVRGGSDVG